MKQPLKIGAILFLLAINLYVFTRRANFRSTTQTEPVSLKDRMDKLPTRSVIELLGDRIDVGRVIEGTKKEVEIQLKNISAGPVEVTSVQTNCTCFSKVGEVGGRFLPGEVKVIKMVLEPRAGTSSWPVLIQTDNLQHYRFVAEGASYVDARVVPGRIELGEIPVNRVIDRDVTVEGDDTTQFNSDDNVQVSADWIHPTLELTPVSQEDVNRQKRGPYSQIAVVHLKLMPTRPGKFSEVLLVKLQSSVTNTSRLVPIAVTGRAVMEVVVRPEALRFDSTERKLLKLRSATGPFELKAHRSDIAELEGERPSGPVESLDLSVKIQSDRPSNRGELVLEILGKEPILISVPITVVKSK